MFSATASFWVGEMIKTVLAILVGCFEGKRQQMRRVSEAFTVQPTRVVSRATCDYAGKKAAGVGQGWFALGKSRRSDVGAYQDRQVS